MMTLPRRYLLATLLAASALLVYYFHYAASFSSPPSGRTPQGLFFGILGFAAMLGALLYSVRRRFLRQAMTPVQVSAEIRKEIKTREQHTMQQLQALQRQILGNPDFNAAQLRQQAKQILKENKVTRYIRVRVIGGDGRGIRLAFERREWAGRLQMWYYWHLMLGCLSILLILVHSGFRFGNPVAVLAFLCLIGVVATGILGYVIYQVVPPALTKIEQRVEKTPEELREDLDEVYRELEAVAQGKSQAFLAIYQQESTIPGISLTPSWRWLTGPADIARDTVRPDRLRLVVREIPGPEQEDFRKMVRLLFRKESLEVSLYPRLRYEYLLKVWLSLHIPLTAGLMVFSLIHILSVLYY